MDFDCPMNVAGWEFSYNRLEDFILLVFVNRSYIFINSGFKGQDRVTGDFLELAGVSQNIVKFIFVDCMVEDDKNVGFVCSKDYNTG